jgi:hypothetical protein
VKGVMVVLNFGGVFSIFGVQDLVFYLQLPVYLYQFAMAVFLLSVAILGVVATKKQTQLSIKLYIIFLGIWIAIGIIGSIAESL